MFFNYLKIGIRNILKYKVFSFINIFGLALAMSVCMLIILMLVDQKSYDQFHPKKDRIYRILSNRDGSGKSNASSPVPLATTLKTDYPIVEDATRLILGVGGDAMYNQKTAEMRGFFADASFFNVFGYELTHGNKSNALTSPNSMVISQEVAEILFGGENPIGKVVEFTDRNLQIIDAGVGAKDSAPVDWGSFTVTGVIPAKTYKSHLKFDVLISAASIPVLAEAEKTDNLSSNWVIYSRAFTYALLSPDKSEEELTAALNDLVSRKYKDIEHLQQFELSTQKLTQITPGKFVGNPVSLRLPIEVYYFLSFLALIIMLSACLNYTNLSIARALTRAKEIGVRKVIGANRKALIYQFLSESALTALLAMVMASILLIFVKSAFMNLWVNRYLNFNLDLNFTVFLIFAVFAILIGLLAGAYPAFNLSNYQPIKALKNMESKRKGKLTMRKVLSASQFVISLFFIITSILIFKQFKHFLDFEYGFRSENIINVALQSNDHQVIANELGTVPGVSVISACSFVPATGMSHGLGVKKMGSEEEYKPFEILSVDENFNENLELEMVAGRNLSPSGEASARLVVVNEAAVKAFDFEHPSEILGQVFDADGEAVEVIGVVKDFRFQTPMLQDQIGPLMMRNNPDKFSYLNIRIASGDLMGTVGLLEDKWKSVDPVHTFKYQFFDEELVKANQGLGDLVTVIGFIAFLAITIACLGLLGMATYTTERREKEVGIRKVLGAEDSKIAVLLSKEFLKLLVISIIIAAPLSYFFNQAWLESFPNRVDFGIGTVLLGSLILLVLGIITIGSQTIRASKRNSVDALRIE